MSVTAPVTNISKNSLHDGPGVRTVVYFKGCTLSCKWCHNPETISGKAEILYIPSKCIHCGKCIDICPSHHKISGDSMLYIRKECKLCGKCVENCPSLALTM
ncbi:MAG: 4Fe-4S binding protein, partial [Clostridia bacterium]|nr:4Fe-4S binding protein [Clostridia bacterium]